MFLAWITTAVKNAVLRGFAEAVQELEELELQLDQDQTPDALAALRGRMTAVLPAPSENGDGAKQVRTKSSK